MKTVSAYQEKLIATYWKNGKVVFLPDINDPDSVANALEKASDWNNRKLFAEGAHVVQLPSDDPGHFNRGDIWNCIKKQIPSLSESMIKGCL